MSTTNINYFRICQFVTWSVENKSIWQWPISIFQRINCRLQHNAMKYCWTFLHSDWLILIAVSTCYWVIAQCIAVWKTKCVTMCVENKCEDSSTYWDICSSICQARRGFTNSTGWIGNTSTATYQPIIPNQNILAAKYKMQLEDLSNANSVTEMKKYSSR